MNDPTLPPTNGTENQNKDQKNNQSLGLTFNWLDWLPHFENEDIPEEQKRELIETLWHVVVAFVDLGFELNPHQQAGQQSCGQNLDLKALLEEAVLQSPATKKAAEQARRLPNNSKPKEPTL